MISHCVTLDGGRGKLSGDRHPKLGLLGCSSDKKEIRNR